MELQFTKMHGAGNDYVYVNGFDYTISQEQATQLAIMLADRHFGVGGDGLVMIDPSLHGDAKMRMYNADGSEGKMCGNAIRCVAKYVYDNNLAKKETLHIQTLSGLKKINVKVHQDKVVSAQVDMGPADFRASSLPVKTDLEEWVNHPFETQHGTYHMTTVSMGNPHGVIFLDTIESLDLKTIGPAFELHEAFPEQINTEFAVVHSPTELSMRVWERGSGETLACGTGACAVVAAAVRNGHCAPDTWITVHLLGGDLNIFYSNDTVLMEGEAVEVFSGLININL